MEAIKEFEILLDISDRKMLYDYGHEEFVNRPDEEDWNVPALRSRLSQDNLDLEDENRLQRRNRMDNALFSMRLMEKDHKKEKKKKEKEGKYEAGEEGEEQEVIFGGIDDLNPSQNLPRRVLPIYRPGETVRGKVILDLSAPVEAESFVIGFKGQAACRIRVYHGRGYYDDRNTEKYVNDRMVVWEKAKGGSVEDQMSLLTTDTVPSRSRMLPAGRHEWPFTFVIPDDARQSTVPMVDSYCDYAHVTYRVKAAIEKGNKMGRGNVAACRGIWVHKKFDIATMGEDLLMPISATEHINAGLFGKSGEVNLKVDLPRKAFTRTESLPIKIQVENMTSSPIEHLSARVVLHGKVRVSRAALRPSRSINLKSKKDFVGPISAKESHNYTITLPLDFSETILNSDLLPGGQMNDCELIDVDYELHVNAKRKGLHRDLEVKIPITLGTENSRPDVYGF